MTIKHRCSHSHDLGKNLKMIGWNDKYKNYIYRCDVCDSPEDFYIIYDDGSRRKKLIERFKEVINNN